MCLIVRKPPAVPSIPRALVEDAITGNADGYGIMYHDGTSVRVTKSPTGTAQDIMRVLESVPADREVLLHLRMATHGDVTEFNTHPFEVIPDKLWMMHNGVVQVGMPLQSEFSDTYHFVQDYLAPTLEGDPDRLENPGVQAFIRHVLGSSNRLVFLDHTGKITVFGEDLGIEWHGLWCSNTYAWSLWNPKPEPKPRILSSIQPRAPMHPLDYAMERDFERDFEVEFAIYVRDFITGTIVADVNEEFRYGT